LIVEGGSLIYSRAVHVRTTGAVVSVRALRDWVQRESRVLGPEFLQVDGFLNHRIAPSFIEAAGRALADAFRSNGVTHVLTAEAAGNVIAYETARRLGAAALYAKKGRAITMARPLTRTVVSPTRGIETELSVSADYLAAGDRVLIVDDFLFEGETSAALAEIAAEGGADLVGFGFVISKEFANGRARLAGLRVPIVVLVPIDSMDPATGEIAFADAAPEG
jgi:xanthine phosphoribosyltransferase